MTVAGGGAQSHETWTLLMGNQAGGRDSDEPEIVVGDRAHLVTAADLALHGQPTLGLLISGSPVRFRQHPPKLPINTND